MLTKNIALSNEIQISRNLQPQKGTMAQQKRYSDCELLGFEASLNKLLKYNKETLSLLEEAATSNGTDDTHKSKSCLEDINAEGSKAERKKRKERQQMYITDIENALTRIKNKVYGVCHSTGQLIPKKRLIACPTATRIIKRPN